jgi:hypothetical protein
MIAFCSRCSYGESMFLDRYRYTIFTVLIILLASCGSATPPSTQHSTATANSTPSTQTVPTLGATLQTSTHLQHIFYIMMENHSASEIIGNTTDAPFLNQLAHTYGTATSYYGVTHPSLPNYLAAISGSFQGIWDDCAASASITCIPDTMSLTPSEYAGASNKAHMFSGQTIVDQLEAHHLTWKAYMQSMPSVGFTGPYDGSYAQKHDPFMYFADIRKDPARMRRIVPFTQFAQDIQTNSVPNFVWITPDVCHDMHGASNCQSYDGLISQGDSFVHTTVREIMDSPAWKQGSAIVITWDENDSASSGCCNSPTGASGTILGGGNVPLIVVPSTGAGHLILSSGSYNHYSLLATIEHMWNLGCLANTCDFNSKTLMTGLFA